MPLARIISHSSAGCRELAMDLLARGYAVEIVEPGKIPDNFADLELRVEPPMVPSMAVNPSGQESGRPPSLDFVQHLKEPMPNFLRRPPSRDDLIAAGIIAAPEPKVVAEIKPQARVAAEIDLQQKAVGQIRPVAFASDSQPAVARANANPQQKVVEEVKTQVLASNQELIAANATPNLLLVPKQEAPVIPATPAISPEPVPTPVRETAKPSRTGITITIHRSRLKESARKVTSRTFLRSNATFLRASAGFAATLALGGVLLMGGRASDRVEKAASSRNDEAKTVLLPQAELRPSVAAASRNSASQSTGQGAVQSSSGPLSGSVKGKSTVKPSLANDLKPEAPTVQREKSSRKAASVVQKHARHHQGDGLIAKDTVTYLKK